MTGFINLNKATGESSAREVGHIKWLTKTPCGHMGTLDPMASGVLPVGIGNACRLFDYFLDKQKVYRAEFTFGQDSDTLDSTGEVVKQGDVPTAEQIKAVLPQFIGTISQMPPKYSAKKINGKCGYQLARAGVEFELQPKEVQIFSLTLDEQLSQDTFSFTICCGGGTYIRSLARDIAQALGTKAIMSALCRTKSGYFELANAVKSEQLTADNWQNYVIPTEQVLAYPPVYPRGNEAKKLFNGLAIPTQLGSGLYKLYDEQNQFYGIAEVANSLLKIRTKLC